jgi:hypothetical protein
LPPDFADVAELVDAQDLGSCALGRGGSSPFIRTFNETQPPTERSGIVHLAVFTDPFAADRNG